MCNKTYCWKYANISICHTNTLDSTMFENQSFSVWEAEKETLRRVSFVRFYPNIAGQIMMVPAQGNNGATQILLQSFHLNSVNMFWLFSYQALCLYICACMELTVCVCFRRMKPESTAWIIVCCLWWWKPCCWDSREKPGNLFFISLRGQHQYRWNLSHLL